MDLKCILCIANNSYAVKTPKSEVTCNTYWSFYKKNKNLDMFSSKREISRSDGRTGDNVSKRESAVQNGRVGTYDFKEIIYININIIFIYKYKYLYININIILI